MFTPANVRDRPAKGENKKTAIPQRADKKQFSGHSPEDTPRGVFTPATRATTLREMKTKTKTEIPEEHSPGILHYLILFAGSFKTDPMPDTMSAGRGIAFAAIPVLGTLFITSKNRFCMTCA